ncbi:holin [Paraburkholderia sp. BR10936]|uniref:holin n=1 Tax=Paraburkholderia sp. BR10936 TaxID=3236993 RepID=UPI0034D17CBC
MEISASEATAYAGSAASLGSSLTLTNVGICVGIATAILTFAANVYFMRQRRAEEREEHLARMAEIEANTKAGVPIAMGAPAPSRDGMEVMENG